MSQPDQLVQWPAIIKLHADDELIFILDAAHFSSGASLQLSHVKAQDILIDSSGAVYRINNGKTLGLVHTGLLLSLHEIMVLLRSHLSNDGNCCVSKFHAHSIREAIMSVFS